MINNLVTLFLGGLKRPKPLFFMVLGAHGIYIHDSWGAIFEFSWASSTYPSLEVVQNR